MFNKHALLVVAYSVLAILLACLGLYGLIASHALLLSILCLLCAGLFVGLNVRLFYKQQHQFDEIMNALKYRDSSFRLSDTHTLGVHQQKTCNELIQKVQQDKFKQAEQVAVFETMLQHIDAGIILVKNQEDVVVCNNSAKRALDIRMFKNAQELLSAKPILTQAREGESIQNGTLFKYFAFTYHNNKYELWLFTTISEQIESTQIEAWQKLIRVLIHEIGNSVAPIHSLSNTLVTVTEMQLANKINDQELINDYIQSLNAIGIRSQSLLGFIEDYRKLTQVPQLDLKSVALATLFSDLKPILKPLLANANTELTINIEPKQLSISVDKKMIEQVLVNIISNATEALNLSDQQNKMINIEAKVNRYGKCEIQINDNADGIEPSAIEKIFVPFFTTKTKGSGIGLALSQQIVHRHKGRIQVTSEVGKGTCFTLVL